MDLPKPRKDINYIPINYHNKVYVYIQDKLGLVSENLMIRGNIYNFLVHLDRSESLEELQEALIRENGGIIIPKDEILKIIHELDKMYLLDSENYREKKEKIVEEFVSKKVREYVFADKSYPADPNRLQKFIDECVKPKIRVTHPIKAIFAPHIEISLAKDIYGETYGSLLGLSYDRVVVLGIGHGLGDGLFSITDKDFDTPLGLIKNDKDAFFKLKNSSSSVLSNTDFDHKLEHSIEFQLIFLKYLLGEFSIIPILCGSLLYFLKKYSRKEFLDVAKDFVYTLQDIIDEKDKKTLVVAGVDFSHIGPKFGHEEDVYTIKPYAIEHDKRLIDAIIKKDIDGFWNESIRVMDKYNVCGFSALALLMEVVSYEYGEVVGYRMNIEEQTRSGVSFAGGILY